MEPPGSPEHDTDSYEDIEIIDLEEKPHTTGSKRGTHRTYRPELATRLSSRQRFMRVLIMVGTTVLVFGILWGSYAPTRNVLLSTMKPLLPTPTATIPPGTDLFYIDANPSWGKLMIDGKQISQLPRIGEGAPSHLSRGSHRFEWVAAPFLPQVCAVTVPPDYVHDTCYSDEIISSPLGNARFFRFPASLGMLSDAQSQELVAVIEAMFNAQAPTTIVERGTSYASDIGPLKVATQILRATLHFKLDVNIHSGANCNSFFGSNSGCMYNRQDCRTLCSAADIIQPRFYDTNTWVVLSAVQPVWDYSTLDETVVAQNQPDIVNGAGNDDFLPLRITWDGARWHVTNDFAALTPEAQDAFNPVCNDTQQHVRIDTSLSYVEQAQAGTNWQYVSDNNWSDGCLAMVTLDTSGMPITPSPTPLVALCLHRFGVFVAVNNIAHQFWPTMPRATADEQRIAQHLMSLYHSS